MEKIKHTLILVALAMLVGCASNRPGSTEETTTDNPDWWFNPGTSESHYYGFGQAKKQNPSLAQKVATQRARGEISNQVKSDIKNLFEDVMGETGLDKNAQANESSEDILKATSNNVMESSTPDKYEKMKDGTVYIRVSYPKDAVSKAIVRAVKKEDALYNEFKASKAFSRLEKEFSSNK